MVFDGGAAIVNDNFCRFSAPRFVRGGFEELLGRPCLESRESQALKYGSTLRQGAQLANRLRLSRLPLWLTWGPKSSCRIEGG